METTERKLKEVVLHFRQYAIDPKTKQRVLKNNGGYTVLVRRNTSQHFEIAVAKCGSKDNFSKSVGSSIVHGRMECQRRLLSLVMLKDDLLRYLESKNNRCRERFSRDFFERLLNRLA